jgi:hypothetical protein
MRFRLLLNISINIRFDIKSVLHIWNYTNHKLNNFRYIIYIYQLSGPL